MKIKQDILQISKYFYNHLKQSLLEEKNNQLELAYQASYLATEKYPAHIWIYLYNVFFAIKTNRQNIYTNQFTFLRYAVSNYRYDNDITAFYNFLLGISDEKNINKSEEIILSLDGDFDHLLAYMYVDIDQMKSFNYIDKAFSKGCRSPFLYFCFYKSFMSGRRYYRKNIMLSFLRWADVHDILTLKIIETNQDLIKNIIEDDIDLFIKLYNKYKVSWILFDICLYLEKNKDYSLQSYNLYKELEQKQIFDENINRALVYSAYKNNIKSMSKFSMLSFIKDPIDSHIAPFVFHNLIVSPNMSGIIKRNNLDEEILNTVIRSIDIEISDSDKIYYNTLFLYVILNINQMDENPSMGYNLFENLFTYKITIEDKYTDSYVEQVLISESTKKMPTSYDFENNVAYISSSVSDFKTVYFDKDKKIIYPKNIKIEKVVQYLEFDFSLYDYFYAKKYISTNLLLAMCLYYFENDIETPMALEVLDRTIKIKGLSKKFRSKLVLAIGNILLKLNNIEKALEYYKEVDDSDINEIHIENIFKVFILCKEYYLALRLLSDWSQNIKEDTLYKGILDIIKHYLPNLATSQRKEMEKLLTPAIYELLIKGYYNEKFLYLVFNYYHGNIFELANLSNSLSEKHIHNIDLDKKILTEAIKFQNISNNVQQVFLRFYKALPNDNVSSDFIYYICYQILACDQKINQQVVNILEELALDSKKENYFLYITLSTCLISYNSKNKDAILNKTMSYLNDINIFFPIFMNLDEKYLTTKQKSLFAINYKSKKGEKISITFKIDDYEPQKISMDYFRFGIYLSSFPMFYNEKVIYSFENQKNKSDEYEYVNTKTLLKQDTENKFFLINNAILYNELFKHKNLEETLQKIYKPIKYTNFKIL